MAKRALIVDDSKTARLVLSNKLQNYGILVDTRESAAEAIDYLYEEAPDAIFMDYEMPGMDGYQALKVIKSNPNTAVIPVMMYTSKAGGLAVSQARALGAVGVLPKQLEPQDFEEVLHSLNLLPDQASLVHGFHGEDLSDIVRIRRHDNVHPLHSSEQPVGRSVEPVSLPLEDYEENIEGDAVARRYLRREMTQTEERIQERLDKHFSELHAELFDLESRHEEATQQMRRIQMGTWFATLLVFITLGLLLYVVNSSWISGENQGGTVWRSELSNQLAQQEEQLTLLSDQLSQNLVAGGVDSMTVSLPLGLLEWAANQGAAFEYGEIPFGDDRALWLSELVNQLREAGFTGTVELRAHYGNFCLQKGAGGEMVLAKPDLDIGECLFAEEVVGSEAWRNEQSVSFANYLNVELARGGGDVEIFLFNSGFNDPFVTYPSAYEVKTAGEWNRVARSNQRLRISLFGN
jgi:CheY-like chemotaxis protein